MVPSCKSMIGILLVTTALTGSHTYGQSLRACDILSFERVRDGTIAPLMEALVEGDVTEVATHLSGKMAARYETLLTENSEYPQYLRDHYRDSSYQLRDVVSSDDGYVAEIEVFWADGSREVFSLELGDDNPFLPRAKDLADCR